MWMPKYMMLAPGDIIFDVVLLKLIQLGKNIAFFGGIPYAKPPVGNLRWQPPVPHGPWKSPRSAGLPDMGHQCVQALLQGHEGNEDCLYLNVHTPTAAVGKNASLPVMIWIHGGSYTSGSGNLYAGFANELVTSVMMGA